MYGNYFGDKTTEKYNFCPNVVYCFCINRGGELYATRGNKGGAARDNTEEERRIRQEVRKEEQTDKILEPLTEVRE